jgi:hypothetical protein
MLAKTFSAPTRSMSMQCLSTSISTPSASLATTPTTPQEQLMFHKIDLIAELKMSKDIAGVKKMKVERAKMENIQDSDVYSEVTRQFTAENFVEQVGYVSDQTVSVFFLF